MQDLRIDSALFDAFPRWSGEVPPGYWASWLGVMTPVSFFAFPQQFLDIYNQRRHETPGFPVDQESILDHIALMEAVLDSDEEFVMVALGAGWGRWLAMGAYAARAKGRAYQLVGVEGEPEHFAWMQQHFQEIGLDPVRYRLIHAAASSSCGDCWFYVGKPAAWYGQRLAADAEIPYEGPRPISLGTEITHNGEVLRRIHSVDLPEIIGDVPVVDYLHMDVQGAELDILSAYPRLLSERVKTVNIGTHSLEIEDGLRRLFSDLGWTATYEIALNESVALHFGANAPRTIQFGDGVQVWLNPRFNHATGYRARAPLAQACA